MNPRSQRNRKKMENSLVVQRLKFHTSTEGCAGLIFDPWSGKLCVQHRFDQKRKKKKEEIGREREVEERGKERRRKSYTSQGARETGSELERELERNHCTGAGAGGVGGHWRGRQSLTPSHVQSWVSRKSRKVTAVYSRH